MVFYQVSILMRRKRIMSSKYRPEAAIEVSRLFPKQLYQVRLILVLVKQSGVEWSGMGSEHAYELDYDYGV